MALGSLNKVILLQLNARNVQQSSAEVALMSTVYLHGQSGRYHQ
jgi:hypothetical protein